MITRSNQQIQDKKPYYFFLPTANLPSGMKNLCLALIFLTSIFMGTSCASNGSTQKVIKPKNHKGYYEHKKHKKHKRTKVVRMKG